MRIATGILCAVGAFASGRASAEIVEIHQRVFGMDCLPCSQAVHAAVSRIAGVVSVEVSMRRGGADIELAPGNTVSIAQLRAAIRKAGYEPKETRLRARGDLVVDHGELLLNLPGQAPLRLEATPRGGPLPCRPGKDVLVEGTIEAGKDEGPLLVEQGMCSAASAMDAQSGPDSGQSAPTRNH
jgi:copper chaperone CopZ